MAERWWERIATKAGSVTWHVLDYDSARDVDCLHGGLITRCGLHVPGYRRRSAPRTAPICKTCRRLTGAR